MSKKRRAMTEQEAENRLAGVRGDDIARALDKFGWMIVRQSGTGYEGRWPIQRPCDDCPAWASNESEPPKPSLRLV
jgi:hypothetical protein